MTDKIIIDGIDVSECMWFIRAEGRYVKDYCCCYMEFDICQEKTDCYYKQLQRKTAECKELKIKLIQKDEVNAFFNTPIEGWSNDPCKICESKNEYQRYKQVLEEIEEYCKKHIKMRLKNYHYQYTNNSRILVPIKKILDEAKG